uniref:Cyclic nucleotide-binding domain-containing protein n=1 Tax=Acrobeloides nanus TaxID=290746 RepID=A0A914DWP1_9BILA
MNRTWDAVVAPLSDHPKIPEFQHQTNLPKKQYRRNDFLFGMSDKIYAEQVDGITPNGFVIFDNPEYNYSFDQENPILNENDEPNLIFVKEGTVKAVKKLQNTSNGVKEIVVTREANQLLGAFELFTEENSYFTIKSSLVMVPLEGGTIAAPLTKVVKIPKREIPLKLWLWLALNTLKNLTPIVQMMDFLIDLVFVEPGRTLYEKEKDEPNEIYVVLDGQFRMQYENKKGLKKIKEYHRGNKIGTKEALEIKPIHREHTLFATRPSVVARFHIELYNNLIRDFGKSGKTKPNIKPDNSITAAQMDQQYFSEIYTIRQMKYRKTVAILPASNSVNISDFVSELFIYTNAYIRGEHNRHLVKYLNKHSIGHREGTVLTGWLRHQEDNNLIVFYEGNHDLDDWTKMCIERADAIIIIENDIMNMPNGQPKGPADWLDKLNNTPLYHQFERTRRELIILWKEKFSGEIVKEVYRKFHNFNIWFSDYHNVYMNSQTFNLMNKVANQYLSGTPLQQIADNTTTQKILFSEKAAIFADVYTKTVEILGDRQLAEVLYKNANDLTLKFIFSDKKTIDDEIVSLRAQGASDQAIKQRICQFLYGMVTLQKKKDLVQKIDDLIDDLIPQDKQQDVKAQLSRSINLNDV